MLNLFYTTMGSGVFLLTPTFIIEPCKKAGSKLLEIQENTPETLIEYRGFIIKTCDFIIKISGVSCLVFGCMIH